MAEELFLSLHKFYPQAEKLFQKRFFYPELVYRPFLTVEEQNSWIAKSSDPSISNFIHSTYASPQYGDQLFDPLGGILVKQGGYLDTQNFIKSTRDFFVGKNSFKEEKFDIQEMVDFEDYIEYKSIRAVKVIFCNGVSDDSHFNWLPVRKLKGEVLQVRLLEKPRVIYNRGVYLVAIADGDVYKVGSTYELGDLSHSITEKGREELEQKMKNLIKIPHEIIAHEWGIRPTTRDRKPILGAWPEYKNRVIFNGLGTKGVSLAPYFSWHLANWLEGKGEILREVNIKRFNPLSSGS